MEYVESLSCELELPEDWEERLRLSSQMVDGCHDQRRHPRVACHSHAALRPCNTLPAISRKAIWSRILLQNISRCGAGLLHSEQLFPEEEALLVFPNGSQRILKVMRCRRLGPKCFEIGGEFTNRSDK